MVRSTFVVPAVPGGVDSFWTHLGRVAGPAVPRTRSMSMRTSGRGLCRHLPNSIRVPLASGTPSTIFGTPCPAVVCIYTNTGKVAYPLGPLCSHHLPRDQGEVSPPVARVGGDLPMFRSSVSVPIVVYGARDLCRQPPRTPPGPSRPSASHQSSPAPSYRSSPGSGHALLAPPLSRTAPTLSHSPDVFPPYSWLPGP